MTSSLVSEITSDKGELECGLIIDSSGCSSQVPSNDAGDVFGETSPEAHRKTKRYSCRVYSLSTLKISNVESMTNQNIIELICCPQINKMFAFYLKRFKYVLDYKYRSLLNRDML